MPTNWPPATAPPWPPPEIGTGPGAGLECSGLIVLIRHLRELGFTQAAPTAAERNAYFRDARCDEGHTVIGRMLVSPGGTRYPFAVCAEATHRDLLALWPPYYCGWDSGRE